MLTTPRILVIDPPTAALEAYSIESETRHKVTYMVTLTNTQEWTCSCPHWMYRREGDCKHVEWVKEWRGEPLVTFVRPAPITRFSVMDV